MRKRPFGSRHRVIVPRQEATYLFAEGPTFHDVVQSQRKRVASEVDAVESMLWIRSSCFVGQSRRLKRSSFASNEIVGTIKSRQNVMQPD